MLNGIDRKQDISVCKIPSWFLYSFQNNGPNIKFISLAHAPRLAISGTARRHQMGPRVFENFFHVFVPSKTVIIRCHTPLITLGHGLVRNRTRSSRDHASKVEVPHGLGLHPLGRVFLILSR